MPHLNVGTSLRLLVCVLSMLPLSAVLPSAAHAVPPLEELLAAGREQALDAHAAEARIQAREADRNLARGALLPDINAQASYTRNQFQIELSLAMLGLPNAMIQRHDQLNAFAQLEIPIFDMAALLRVRAARGDIEAAQLDQLATLIDIDTRVARAYYSMVSMDALAQAAHDAENVARDNLHDVEVRLSAGVATPLDQERAAADVAARSQAVADADLQRRAARRDLWVLTGVRIADDDVGEVTASVEEQGPIDRYLEHIEELPAIRANGLRLDLAHRRMNAARSAFLPTIGAMGQETYTNAAGFTRTHQWQVQIFARIRLDFVKTAQLQQASATAALASIEADRAALNARTAVEASYDRVTANIARTTAARSQEEATQHAADTARVRYEAGDATQLDVIQANRDAFAAKVARIQAESELTYSRLLLRLVSSPFPEDLTHAPAQ